MNSFSLVQLVFHFTVYVELSLDLLKQKPEAWEPSQFNSFSINGLAKDTNFISDKGVLSLIYKEILHFKMKNHNILQKNKQKTRTICEKKDTNRNEKDVRTFL